MDKGGLIVGKGHVLGVSVTAVDGERMALSYVHLHRKRNGVHVRAQGSASDPKALSAAMGTRMPVALVFATDRCVHRVLDHAGTPDELLQQAFPNAPVGELIASLWRTGTTTGASMARRNTVLDAVERIHAAGFRVVRLAIGPWGLLGVRSLLDDHASTWEAGGHVFEFQEESVRAVTPRKTAQHPLDIHGDRIEAEHALAFAAAWEHLTPTAERLDGPVPELRPAQRQERARRSYETGLVVTIALLLVLVGGERLVAHHLHRMQASLQTSANAHGEDLQRVQDLRERVQALEHGQHALGADHSERLALQAARIAASVPEDIRLERLTERPLRSPLKEQAPLDLAPGVVVQGTCPDAHALDAWITVLKQVPGITSVKLSGYAVDAEDGRPHFRLELDA